jgi:hypothetical protein
MLKNFLKTKETNFGDRNSSSYNNTIDPLKKQKASNIVSEFLNDLNQANRISEHQVNNLNFT